MSAELTVGHVRQIVERVARTATGDDPAQHMQLLLHMEAIDPKFDVRSFSLAHLLGKRKQVVVS